jgi:excisionase family DNA binding protein
MITMFPARPAKALAPLLLDVPEAAAMLRVGRTTMWDLVQSGEIRSCRIRGRVLVPVDALREYVRTLPGGARNEAS